MENGWRQQICTIYYLLGIYKNSHRINRTHFSPIFKAIFKKPINYINYTVTSSVCFSVETFWPVKLSDYRKSLLLNTKLSSSNTSDTYLLTPCSSVLLEKLTDLQLVKKFPAFYGSSPHSQVHATCPYPELAPSSPHTHIPLPVDQS
jgi:hypothetical protein